MKNKIMALMLLPGLVNFAIAGTNFGATDSNIKQVNGAAVNVGAGAAGTGTQRVILASDSPGGTVTLGAGSALAGKFGIDQTTPGTTNGVQVNAALPVGANVIGKVSIDQATPGTTNGVQVNAALPTGTNSIGKAVLQVLDNAGVVTSVGFQVNGASVPISMPQSAAPTIAKVTATTTSGQLVAASSTRKGIEIDCDDTNTDSVAINFGTGAAVYANHKIIKSGSNWQPPPGVNVTSAIQIISNTGSQVCRATEYF